MVLLDGLWSLLGVYISFTFGNFWNEHNVILQKIENQGIGCDIVLSSKEKIVNDYLMRLKTAEIEEGLKDPLNFAPALHFFDAKDKIEKSKVFHILRKLPKGATLYSHNDHIASEEFIFSLTYRDNLYGCFQGDIYKLRFFNGTPTKECDWKPLCELRKTNANYDVFLKSQLTLRDSDPYEAYPTVQSVWEKYEKVYATIESLISYKPIFLEYLYRLCLELYQDNIMYLESQISPQNIYDLSGKVCNDIEVAGLYLDVLYRFKCDYPDFYSAKMVYKPLNVVDNTTLSNGIDTYFNILKTYPDIFSGFDLSCIESSGKPVIDFLQQISRLIKRSQKLYYHGKEIRWYNKNIKINILDSVLLNATRIGHSDVIVTNKAIGKLVKEKNIAIEVSPIAEQVLKYSSDVKNNPGAVAIALGYPIIITSGDSAVFGTKGLSYDWYMAFMGLAEECQDLRFLKQLALNSLYHNGMDGVELDMAVKLWKIKWAKFIDDIYSTATADIFFK